VDGDWSACGLAGEVIAGVTEALDPQELSARPARLTLPPAPAPTSGPLERLYYPTVEDVVHRALGMLGTQQEAG